MLAIPLQGFAAAAMLFCAPSHHNIVAANSPLKDHHVVHRMAQDVSPTAHQHHNQAQSVTQDGDGAAATAKVVDGKCSACSICCIGSAIISTQSFDHVALTNSEWIPFIQKAIISYSPEWLDPPPKSFLA